MALSYDKVISKTLCGEKLRYGIVYGNEKIVFIKTGAGGTVKGHRDKYLQIAHRLHARIGATVICASNPWIDAKIHLEADKEMIASVAAERHYALYLLGASDGAYHNLLLAQQLKQTTRYLGINPSLVDFADFVKQLQANPQVDKLLVYGTKDESYPYVPQLKELACENLEILTVAGADHTFKNMLETYISLADLL